MDVIFKQKTGVGDVYFNSLTDVLKLSSIRINNSNDLKCGFSFDSEQILERCLEAERISRQGCESRNDNHETIMIIERGDANDVGDDGVPNEGHGRGK